MVKKEGNIFQVCSITIQLLQAPLNHYLAFILQAPLKLSQDRGAGMARPSARTAVWVKFGQFKNHLPFPKIKYKAKVCRSNDSKVTTNYHIGPFLTKNEFLNLIQGDYCYCWVYQYFNNGLMVWVRKTMFWCLCQDIKLFIFVFHVCLKYFGDQKVVQSSIATLEQTDISVFGMVPIYIIRQEPRVYLSHLHAYLECLCCKNDGRSPQHRAVKRQ